MQITGPATASSSSPARTTGTVPPRTASWSTSPSESGSPVMWGRHVTGDEYVVASADAT